jgi:Flp pilus assembly protein TadG
MIFLRFVKHFRLDASGSIFILAALLIPMAVMVVAGAIEYSRINSTKSQLDSYALIASQQGTNAARIALSQVTNPQQTDIKNAISTGTTAANNAFTQMAAKVKSATATPTSTGAFNSTTNVINVNLNYTAQFNFVFKFMSTVFGSNFSGKNNTNLTVAVQTNSTTTTGWQKYFS